MTLAVNKVSVEFLYSSEVELEAVKAYCTEKGFEITKNSLWASMADRARGQSFYNTIHLEEEDLIPLKFHFPRNIRVIQSA